jgi:hypothetical protein
MGRECLLELFSPVFAGVGQVVCSSLGFGFSNFSL